MGDSGQKYTELKTVKCIKIGTQVTAWWVMIVVFINQKSYTHRPFDGGTAKKTFNKPQVLHSAVELGIGVTACRCACEIRWNQDLVASVSVFTTCPRCSTE